MLPLDESEPGAPDDVIEDPGPHADFTGGCWRDEGRHEPHFWRDRRDPEPRYIMFCKGRGR